MLNVSPLLAAAPSSEEAASLELSSVDAVDVLASLLHAHNDNPIAAAKDKAKTFLNFFTKKPSFKNVCVLVLEAHRDLNSSSICNYMYPRLSLMYLLGLRDIVALCNLHLLL